MIFDDLLREIEIPRFVKVHYHMDTQAVENIPRAVFETFEACDTRSRIRKDMRVCIAVGSREIAHFDVIVRAVVDYVRFCGAQPFIIPAMGSHGGSRAEGQRAIIESYGITEEAMNAPILASMETVEIGRTEKGMAVQMDKYAANADYIIPIGRIKPHTDFHGRIESGLCKMLVIGIGKQYGAYICHKYGFHNMEKNIWDFSKVIVRNKPNIIALGVIENRVHDTYMLKAVPGDRIHEEEPKLLDIAREQLGRLPFDAADVLIVNRIGKEISGAGMDPNVTGRPTVLPREKPFFQSIAVLDVSEKSHGNCGGVGAADVTTQRLMNKYSFEETYPNAITVGNAYGTKIPPVMPNDRLAIKFALRGVADFFDEREIIRTIWIEDTLSLEEFWISESLVETAGQIPGLEIISQPLDVLFDEDGNVKRIG